MAQNQVEAALNKIINGFVDLKEALTTNEETVKVSAQSVEPQPKPDQEVQTLESDEETFEMLKKALETDKWPAAVNSSLVCDPNSETDKVERGKGVIELMIEENLKELKFLDIGCGEGHCAHLSANYGTKVSVGYDIKKNDRWEEWHKSGAGIFTDN